MTIPSGCPAVVETFEDTAEWGRIDRSNRAVDLDVDPSIRAVVRGPPLAPATVIMSTDPHQNADTLLRTAERDVMNARSFDAERHARNRAAAEGAVAALGADRSRADRDRRLDVIIPGEPPSVDAVSGDGLLA